MAAAVLVQSISMVRTRAACCMMRLRQHLTRLGGSRSDTRDTDMVRCTEPPTAATMTAASSMPKLVAMPCARKLPLSA